MKDHKVFCIGFHKTGTSSLGEALEILGYRVKGVHGAHDPDIAKHVHESALALVPEYDAFQDNPWPILYRELDAAFPGSRFILTIRSTEEWLASAQRYFAEKSTPMREWIYGEGTVLGHEDLYVERYERHNREVLEYFRDRPNDFLVMRLTEGDGWDQLCAFLRCEIPATPFPHAKKATAKSKRRDTFRRLRDRLRLKTRGR